jgi:hypothetical protein
MSKQTKTTLAALLATSVAAFAGTSTKTIKPTEKESFASGLLGVEVSSAYINKGRLFDSSAVFQPFAAVIIPTKLELGGVKVAVVGATKQNLHTADPLKSWARSEVNAGLSFNKDRLTLVSTYEWVSSPNDSYTDSQGVNLTLSFDDSGVSPIALKPHVRGYFGTKGGFEPVANYYEVGIAPSVAVYNTEVAFPVNLGFGSKNFYKNGEKYGYTSVGVSTSTPLSQSVSLIAGVTYFNTNDKVNSGTKDLWLTSAGIVVKF